ncbi:aquaporin AQPAn.G [Biomphalaria glabrata]|nr:aquaporin AQPAn.G [Biomphalaria glabrata]
MSIASIPDRLRDELSRGHEGETIGQRLINRELNDLKNIAFWKGAVGEFVGCLLLVVFAVGMGLKQDGTEGPPLLQVAIGAGFLLAVLITALSTVSGGHVNPAISLGFLITGQISLVKCLVYILFQSAGAIAGAGLLKTTVPDSYVGTLGVVAPGEGVSSMEALGAEIIITFLLLFATLAMLDPGRSDMQGSVPLMVGLIVTVNALFAAPISGGCMNPIRSLGPAVIQENFENAWIYWVGPMIGAIVGSLCYDLLFATQPIGLRRLCKSPEVPDSEKAYPKKLEKKSDKPLPKHLEKNYHKNDKYNHKSEKIYQKSGNDEQVGDLLLKRYRHIDPRENESRI